MMTEERYVPGCTPKTVRVLEEQMTYKNKTGRRGAPWVGPR
jgi:hypothetical protein